VADERTDSYTIFDRFSERWPKAGDRLLSPGRDTSFAEKADERNYRLLKGYKRAGDILVQNALEELYDCENLVFPALFNYRHYIELALKAIIEDHGAFAGVSLGSRNHELPELWQMFLKIAIAFGNDDSAAEAVAVGNCIDEFVKIDANSTTFRYARDLKGCIPALPRDGLDLVRLHDVMNGIENFFECADLDFTHKAELAVGCAYKDFLEG